MTQLEFQMHQECIAAEPDPAERTAHVLAAILIVLNKMFKAWVGNEALDLKAVLPWIMRNREEASGDDDALLQKLFGDSM